MLNCHRGESGLRKLKLLIADAGEEFRLALEERLHNTYTICGSGEGNEAMALLQFESLKRILKEANDHLIHTAFF